MCSLLHTHRTLKAHDTAHDHDVPWTPLLHVWHHFFDHADHAKEVGLEHFFHLLDADAFYRSKQAHTCVVDWHTEIERDRHRRRWCNAHISNTAISDTFECGCCCLAGFLNHPEAIHISDMTFRERASFTTLYNMFPYSDESLLTSEKHNTFSTLHLCTF